MKQERTYPRLQVSRKGEGPLRSGHPWVYGAELTTVSGAPENGGLVDVVSRSGNYLGTGFYNDRSKISVRLLSRNANDTFDEAFWLRRLGYAVAYRRAVMPGEDFRCCRLIHGESDQLPGLTVDRYGSLLVAQTVCLGMEKIKPLLFQGLCGLLTRQGEEIRGLYERNDLALRDKEGLPRHKGWFPLSGLPLPDAPVTEIVENGIRYLVDVENGQKTGFFLDQKYNRQAVSRIAAGRRVLDCFTHTGSFGLNAAKGGAAHVTSVDVSEEAIQMARDNACRNGLLGVMDFRTADVFELLTRMAQDGVREYDFIILDPPAFTKSRETVNSALRGYREINSKAMKLLPRGGYLATCSCSHFVSDGLFRGMLREAAADAAVSLRQIEGRQQAPDHPILWNVPETDYLKFYLFQVV